MNIFKILRTGDGSIKEPNVSAFLGYLLNPYEDHSLKSKFLELLLKQIIFDQSGFDDLIADKNNKQVRNLSNRERFNVKIILESQLYDESMRNRKDSDILVLVETNKGILQYVFCLEIKIQKSSFTIGQLSDLHRNLVATLKNLKKTQIKFDKDKPPKIGFLFITPKLKKTGRATTEITNFPPMTNGCPIKHIIWINKSIINKARKPVMQNSMVQLLEGLIETEKHGEIEPLNDQFRFLLRSFLNFIQTGFKAIELDKASGKFSYDTGNVLFQIRKHKLNHFPLFAKIYHWIASKTELIPKISEGKFDRVAFILDDEYPSDVAMQIFFPAGGLEIQFTKNFTRSDERHGWLINGPHLQKTILFDSNLNTQDKKTIKTIIESELQ